MAQRVGTFLRFLGDDRTKIFPYQRNLSRELNRLPGNINYKIVHKGYMTWSFSLLRR